MKRIITIVLLGAALLAPAVADAKYYMDKYEAKSYVRHDMNKIVRDLNSIRWYQIYDCYRITRSRWNCGVEVHFNGGGGCDMRYQTWYDDNLAWWRRGECS